MRAASPGPGFIEFVPCKPTVGTFCHACGMGELIIVKGL